MRKVMPRELVVGQQIVENPDEVLDGKRAKLTRVSHVENYACSKRDTHVNHNACYAWSVPVSVAG